MNPKKLIGRFLFCVALCLTSAKAQKIQSIRVEGNQRIETAAVLEAIKLNKGSVLRRQQIQDVIRSIYALDYFDDVAIFFDEETGELLIKLNEKKVVRSIVFKGNEKEKTEDLKEQLMLKVLDFLDEQKLADEREKLQAYYDDKGFYLVDIETKVEEISKTDVNVVFNIQENRKVRIRRISFIGNEALSEKELKSVMFTRERDFLAFLSGAGTYREEMLLQDQQILKDYYGKKGYIEVKIKPPTVQLSPDKRNLSVIFEVDEGDLYQIGNVDISGDLIQEKSELLEKVKIKKGEIADTSKIQSDIFVLSGVYADEGYAYANVIPQDRRNKETKIVDINYFIQPGQKVHVHQIRFVGNDSTRDKVLRREMEIVEGELFNRTKIQQSKANIERLALFEEVKLTTPRSSKENAVDIVIEVKEKQTGTFSIGAGFNTLESFQVLGRIEKRNLFGYGVDISLDARVGGLTQAFNLQYRDEHIFDSEWGFTLNAFNIQRRFSNFDLTSRGGNVGVDYPLYRKGLERIRLGVTYALVDQNLQDLSPTVENLFDSGLTSSMTVAVSRDTRNRVFEPTKGSFLRVSEEVAGGIFGGDNGFSKLGFDGRWFFSPFEKSKIPIVKDSVIAFHFELGYVSPLQDGDRVPLFERYFPGGILSLRGFQIRSLGPKLQIASSADPTALVTSDFVIGGNKQVIFNAEYIFPIIKPANIKGVMFFDMGNAFDNGESLLTLKGQRQSVGFGVRWFSPIGPLRFEWGYPLDRKEDEDRSVFDFTIGSLF